MSAFQVVYARIGELSLAFDKGVGRKVFDALPREFESAREIATRQNSKAFTPFYFWPSPLGDNSASEPLTPELPGDALPQPVAPVPSPEPIYTPEPAVAVLSPSHAIREQEAALSWYRGRNAESLAAPVASVTEAASRVRHGETVAIRGARFQAPPARPPVDFAW